MSDDYHDLRAMQIYWSLNGYVAVVNGVDAYGTPVRANDGYWLVWWSQQIVAMQPIGDNAEDAMRTLQGLVDGTITYDVSVSDLATADRLLAQVFGGDA